MSFFVPSFPWPLMLTSCCLTSNPVIQIFPFFPSVTCHWFHPSSLSSLPPNLFLVPSFSWFYFCLPHTLGFRTPPALQTCPRFYSSPSLLVWLPSPSILPVNSSPHFLIPWFHSGCLRLLCSLIMSSSLHVWTSSFVPFSSPTSQFLTLFLSLHLTVNIPPCLWFVPFPSFLVSMRAWLPCHTSCASVSSHLGTQIHHSTLSQRFPFRQSSVKGLLGYFAYSPSSFLKMTSWLR